MIEQAYELSYAKHFIEEMRLKINEKEMVDELFKKSSSNDARIVDDLLCKNAYLTSDTFVDSILKFSNKNITYSMALDTLNYKFFMSDQ